MKVVVMNEEVSKLVGYFNALNQYSCEKSENENVFFLGSHIKAMVRRGAQLDALKENIDYLSDQGVLVQVSDHKIDNDGFRCEVVDLEKANLLVEQFLLK